MRVYKQRPFVKLPVIHEEGSKPPALRDKTKIVEPTIAIRTPKIEEFVLNYKYKCSRMGLQKNYESEMKVIENIVNRYSYTEFISHRDVEILILIFQSCLNRTGTSDDKSLQDYLIGNLVKDLGIEEHVFIEGLFSAKGEVSR